MYGDRERDRVIERERQREIIDGCTVTIGDRMRRVLG